ncbi:MULTISPECIES: UDP-3-O-acyl-N-acetylglucosamine deacetylase [Pelosinus]|uniref:UDP-3-O-acyl-N-acetylglucosamine deacetylase n=1 Tax=Pelosinus fermentans B4 TaxID=1149862 RepID=I9ASQ0_9FIRM|nr:MULTISPECIES: UDP-3-O-acyl-N-acetylglucosamine deacetylase [Pelosinus]EIW15982.1 UDP-3-0-acyl N-acetylglucosamine deacetylase [Pelosinus fermentans B4]EIW27312.1 UDP-3-O-(3-hydroxymyristoyl) N-acetylglucosamine deacetylase [Pelosinus fermentans A11]OAM92732.1 UDP-3-O-(3-hydroxymyristoyl) N-acetylglucosamine deacetylase [Pelosinus fermentans DSM 17108]SDQ55173.1 UDP-3-O-[3-hydroxymyristoyl] N-acetylglucosamine deacetylase [Pelosinus fermentans]
MQQTTIAKAITYTGIGLHSGQDVTITIKPAPPDTGIVFVRIDLPGAPQVAAMANNVTNAMRATTLEKGLAKVFTVEHLLAAFFAMEVDNCLVEINAVEPPVGDGSSLPFVQMIQEAGVIEQNASRRFVAVTEAQTVRVNDKFITILPYDGFRVTFTSINSHPMLGVQFGDYEITRDSFISEIASARTIGFMHEVEQLKSQGLALGGSLENAVVYDDVKALTPLRFQDELVRHKILDIIGDLALAGRIRGHVIAVKSSHALNTALAKKIVDHILVRS